MKINSIRLVNYRCHRDLNVSFDLGFSAIAGVNGSGKTALLNAICDSLSVWTDSFGHPVQRYHSMSEDGLARLEITNHAGRVRFEPQYPVTLSVEVEIVHASHRWQMIRNASDSFGMAYEGDAGSRDQYYSVRSKAAVAGSPNQDLPIIAFYRANRNWLPEVVDDLQAVMERSARADGYRNWWNASIDNGAMQKWFVAKSIERLQVSSERRVSFKEVQDDELALVNTALSDALPDATNLRFDAVQKTILVDWKTARNAGVESAAFENLSDGQRTAICLICDIARRMCLLNPHLGAEVTRLTQGVILIDELDVHLHPRWQRNLTRGLRSAFPNVQFIVTSHSPQVLSELQPDEIILLKSGDVAHPQVSYGMDSSSVLDEIMEASSRPPNVEKLLENLFEAIERNHLNEARTQLSELRELAPGISEIGGAAALLKRKEVIGR